MTWGGNAVSHFRNVFSLCLVRNSCRNEFNFYVNDNSFPCERFSFRYRFETKKANFEITDCDPLGNKTWTDGKNIKQSF